MTIEQRVYSGTRARDVLENEEFTAAFEAIKNEVIETWKNSPARDLEGREKCYIYLHLLEKIRINLTQTLETGKLAELELQHKQSLFDRLRG